MTNSDINNVVRLHSSQLQSESPYSEDYYYQSYLKAKKGEDHPPTPPPLLFPSVLYATNRIGIHSFVIYYAGKESQPHLALCETPPRVFKRKGDGPGWYR